VKRSEPTHAAVEDREAVRRYLLGLEGLAREAVNSHDPAVVFAALRVLASQRGTVQSLCPEAA
jgi:hypothetical protein